MLHLLIQSFANPKLLCLVENRKVWIDSFPWQQPVNASKQIFRFFCCPEVHSGLLNTWPVPHVNDLKPSSVVLRGDPLLSSFRDLVQCHSSCWKFLTPVSSGLEGTRTKIPTMKTYSPSLLKEEQLSLQQDFGMATSFLNFMWNHTPFCQ